MKRLLPVSLFYVGLAFFCVGLVMVPSACSGNQRQSTLHATLVTLDGAHDVLHAYDVKHQVELADKAASREEAEKAVAAWIVKRDEMTVGFGIAYHAIAIALSQSDDPSLKAALAEGAKLLSELRKIGVPGL